MVHPVPVLLVMKSISSHHLFYNGNSLKVSGHGGLETLSLKLISNSSPSAL